MYIHTDPRTLQRNVIPATMFRNIELNVFRNLWILSEEFTGISRA